MAAEDSAQPPDPVATEPGEEQPAEAPTQEPAEAPAPTPGRRPGHAADWHIEPPPEVGPSIEEQLDENRKSTRPDEEKLDFLCQLLRKGKLGPHRVSCHAQVPPPPRGYPRPLTTPCSAQFNQEFSKVTEEKVKKAKKERQERIKAEQGDLLVGDRVTHPVHGPGTVTEVKSWDKSVVVTFDIGDDHTYMEESQWKLERVVDKDEVPAFVTKRRRESIAEARARDRRARATSGMIGGFASSRSRVGAEELGGMAGVPRALTSPEPSHERILVD